MTPDTAPPTEPDDSQPTYPETAGPPTQQDAHQGQADTHPPKEEHLPRSDETATRSESVRSVWQQKRFVLAIAAAALAAALGVTLIVSRSGPVLTVRVESPFGAPGNLAWFLETDNLNKPCRPNVNYIGQNIIVSSGDGEVVGSGRLGSGVIEASATQPGQAACVMTTGIDLPDAARYQISAEHGDGEWFTPDELDELRWEITFPVGW